MGSEGKYWVARGNIGLRGEIWDRVGNIGQRGIIFDRNGNVLDRDGKYGSERENNEQQGEYWTKRVNTIVSILMFFITIFVTVIYAISTYFKEICCCSNVFNINVHKNVIKK